MARLARVVVPDYPLHVTQRGNQRKQIFHSDRDHHIYLKTLKKRCDQFGVSIHAYCLMPNHVHLVAVPSDKTGLARALGIAHCEYARWYNFTYETSGHLWQNRFYSCLLDDDHYWHTLRYVELNPVRCGRALEATHWQWSSARERVGAPVSHPLVNLDKWRQRYDSAQWIEALNRGIADADLLRRIREATRIGRPMGTSDFVKQIEYETGRSLIPRKPGPMPKAKAASAAAQVSIVNSVY